MQRRMWMAYSSLSLALLLVPGHASATKRKILVVGDSLSAEYGLARGSGWVALLEARLKAQKREIEVVNASISGETTSGGRSRLGALLKKEQPSLVIIELGGNDALRGLPLAMTRDNLRAMVQDSKKAGARVLLVGMQMPANYGAAYGKEFAGSFETVAREEKVALVPFLLAGLAELPDAEAWFQPDRIHPLAKAHPLMLEQVWKGLAPLL
jgi:acyl-CoA thioesterase I